jgi:hypothetical protein
MSDDFTEQRYIEILDSASARFDFKKMSDAPKGEGLALWRHDIDFSPNRALALARIEAERGLYATYNVQVSSLYYSVFESEVISMLQSIAALGHEIGLHFDPSIYKNPNAKSLLVREVQLLSDLLGLEVKSFSLHNPTTYDLDEFSNETYEGLVNATAPVWREHFTYCSDSNGMWRFTPLIDLIADENVTNLYLLSHPVWWQPQSMLPREMIRRSIDGRAKSLFSSYDDFLDVHNRTNLGKVSVSVK